MYRIQVSQKKNSPDTHYIQQYIKSSDDDTYKVGKIMASGDFFNCNQALAELIVKPPVITEDKAVDEITVAAPVPPAPSAPPKPETDLAIYQLKGGEATRDIRFESYDSLVKHGMTPDIANYDLVYEGSMAEVTDSTDLRMQLEAVFHKFNMDRPEDFTGHSLSVSDVVVVRNQAFYVDSFGFKPLAEFREQRVKQDMKNISSLDALKPQKIAKLR